MAKKGTRSAKVSQQRAREEQWKRRLGTQAQGDAGMLVADGSRSADENISAGAEPATPTSTMIFAPRSAVSRSSATSATTRPSASATTAMRATNTATAAATQRRAAAAARTARTRATSTAMSVDDEMYYVRSDIRRLIMLTVVCVLVLILLFFLIPR